MSTTKNIEDFIEMLDENYVMSAKLHKKVEITVKCILKDIPIPTIVIGYENGKHILYTQKELIYGLMLFLENKLTVDSKLFNQFSVMNKRIIKQRCINCLEISCYTTDDIEMILELYK